MTGDREPLSRSLKPVMGAGAARFLSDGRTGARAAMRDCRPARRPPALLLSIALDAAAGRARGSLRGQPFRSDFNCTVSPFFRHRSRNGPLPLGWPKPEGAPGMREVRRQVTLSSLWPFRIKT